MIFTKNDNNDIYKVGCSHTSIIDAVIHELILHSFTPVTYDVYFANTIAFFNEMWITKI